MENVLVNGDRPTFVYEDNAGIFIVPENLVGNYKPFCGARVYISVHDAEYTRQSREWKRKLFEAHPDRGGNPKEFRELMKKREAWKEAEYKWYAKYKLLPPGVHKKKIADDEDEFGLPWQEKSKQIKTLPVETVHALARGRVGSKAREIKRYLEANPDAKPAQIAKDLGLQEGNVRTTMSRERAKAKKPQKLMRIQRVVDALLDYAPHSVEDLMELTGLPKSHIITSICRLRGRGFQIVSVNYGNRKPTYTLLPEFKDDFNARRLSVEP